MLKDSPLWEDRGTYLQLLSLGEACEGVGSEAPRAIYYCFTGLQNAQWRLRSLLFTFDGGLGSVVGSDVQPALHQLTGICVSRSGRGDVVPHQ